MDVTAFPSSGQENLTAAGYIDRLERLVPDKPGGAWRYQVTLSDRHAGRVTVIVSAAAMESYRAFRSYLLRHHGIHFRADYFARSDRWQELVEDLFAGPAPVEVVQ